jgi:hypothetical protein
LQTVNLPALVGNFQGIRSWCSTYFTPPVSGVYVFRFSQCQTATPTRQQSFVVICTGGVYNNVILGAFTPADSVPRLDQTTGAGFDASVQYVIELRGALVDCSDTGDSQVSISAASAVQIA